MRQFATKHAAARTVGASAAQLEPLRPWLASLQLALASITKAGYVPANGGDQILHARAAATGKPIKGFETAPQQIGFIADMSEDAQLAMLRGAHHVLSMLMPYLEEGQKIHLQNLIRAYAENTAT